MSEDLRSLLVLELETEFFKRCSGLRYPTAIRFKESYQGGPLITGLRGTKGWLRTQTVTIFSDYMFFKVDLDITYE